MATSMHGSFTVEYKLKVIKWYHANGENKLNTFVVGVTEDLQWMPGAGTYHNWFQVLASDNKMEGGCTGGSLWYI